MGKKKFEAVALRTHEGNTIELKFDNEGDAASFRVWWERSGSSSFRGWTERSAEFYEPKAAGERCQNCGRTAVARYCDRCKSEGV